MPTFATPGPITATVEVAGAHVQVTATDRTDTVVTVEPRDPASRTDVKVAAGTTVGYAAGQLSVKTTVPGDKDGSVAITIELPAGSNLTAYLAHSAVRADGPAGACELHVASGQVRLDRAGPLRASITAGTAEIGHITGRADIDGATFTLRIGQADGPAKITSSGGQARVGHAAADLSLNSAAGSFDIDRADAAVTATTASGDIRIGRMAHGQASLTNGSGNIEVGIADGATARVDATSERGSVRNTLPPPPIPDTPDAMVTVHARTRHGDIVIHPAAR
jgi:Putative adhesin